MNIQDEQIRAHFREGLRTALAAIRDGAEGAVLIHVYPPVEEGPEEADDEQDEAAAPAQDSDEDDDAADEVDVWAAKTVCDLIDVLLKFTGFVQFFDGLPDTLALALLDTLHETLVTRLEEGGASLEDDDEDEDEGPAVAHG